MNNRSLLNKLILFGGVFMLGLSVWAKDGMVIIRYEISASEVYHKQTKEGDLIIWSEQETKKEVTRETRELWEDGKLKETETIPHNKSGGNSGVSYVKIDRENGEVVLVYSDIRTNVSVTSKAKFSENNFTINMEEFFAHTMKQMFGPNWNTNEFAKQAMAAQMEHIYPNLAKRIKNLKAKIETKPSSKSECSLKDRSCETNFTFEMQATFEY